VLTQYLIKTESRDRKFYDQFDYAFQFRQQEIFLIRGLPDNENLLKFISLRKRLTQRFSVSMDQIKKQEYFSNQSVENLMATRDLMLNWPAEFKFTVSGDWANIYTNDLNLIAAVERLPQVTPGRYIKQAVVDRPKDMVVVQAPKYQHRTYLREYKMPQKVRSQLLAWLQGQCDQDQVHARPSRALWEWLNDGKPSWRAQWCQRYYYIEHNDLGYETMLAMLVPGAVRKTVSVISREENHQAQSSDK